ncbi:MAG TPA: hypothetical protein VNV43_15290, partial [Candidatus Acidoferrales bacterium]|nr:hypothetical protein [Candidatus Acidoferrales bacterium]
EHEFQHLEDYLKNKRCCKDFIVGEDDVRKELCIMRGKKCADAIGFFPDRASYSKIIVADAKWQGHDDDFIKLPYQLGNAVACVLKLFKVDQRYADIIEPLFFLHELPKDRGTDKSHWNGYVLAPASGRNIFVLKKSTDFMDVFLRCDLDGPFDLEKRKVKALRIQAYVENPPPDITKRFKAIKPVYRSDQ